MSRPPFLLLLALLAVTQLPVATAAGNEAPSHKSEAELKQLRARIDQLQGQIKRNEGKQSELSQRLQESERLIGRIARGLRVLRGRLERQSERVSSLRQQEVRQQAALEREQELLAQQVRSAYVMGRQEQFRILLNQQDPATVSRMLAFYDYLNRERVRRMQDIRHKLEELADTRRDLIEQQQQLEHLQKEREERRSSLEREQAARRQVLQGLAGELKDQSSRLGQLRNDEKQLRNLLQGLQDALADVPTRAEERIPFTKARGKIAWPVKGRIQHSFGEAKIGKLQWDGVMIEAPEGREVSAVHPGRVAFADWLRGFGLLLIIDHGEGYMTLYGHNQSLFKEAGDWVESGEPVAAAGSTGGKKKSGVYFAIRHHGKAIDPRRWCRRIKGKSVG